jgi:hypothetical protein
MTAAPAPSTDRQRWLEIRDELLEWARALGADTVATISHACQREWCDAGEQTLQVRNYVSLLADALGIERGYPVDALGLQAPRRSRRNRRVRPSGLALARPERTASAGDRRWLHVAGGLAAHHRAVTFTAHPLSNTCLAECA